MKIAFLWTGLSGYMNACLKELSGRDGVDVLVCHEVPRPEAPFDESLFSWIPNRVCWRCYGDLTALESMIEEYSPDIIVIPSWHVRPYRRIARRFKGRSWRVMIMDNPWRGSLKQRFGSLASPFYVKPIADVVWLPGERQAAFARRLGFPQSAIMRGSFTCDNAAFSAVHDRRTSRGSPIPRRFIFVGRLVPAKGIDTLLEAYRLYGSRVSDPWPLICCGSGPMSSLLQNQRGITVEGFIQPDQMPARLESAGCLILPSVFEPWALVVHEAAAAGRLIIASENVGAVTHLVQPGYNGFIFNSNDVLGLANLMSRVSSMSDEQLDELSRASFLLSHQFSLKQWANTLLQSYESSLSTPSREI